MYTVSLVCLSVVSSKGSSAGFSQVRDLLRRDFNRSVELQVQTSLFTTVTLLNLRN